MNGEYLSAQWNADIETVRRGGIDYLHVLSRWDLRTGELDRDPLSPFFGEPTFYEITAGQRTVRIHPSRVIRFVGAPQSQRRSQQRRARLHGEIDGAPATSAGPAPSTPNC